MRRTSAGRRFVLPWMVVLGAALSCGKPALEGESSSSAPRAIGDRESPSRVDGAVGRRDKDSAGEDVWQPPRYPPMEGLDGAMQRLAEGDLRSSFRRVRDAGIEAGPTGESELRALSSAVLAGSARAALLEDRPETALALLEALLGRGAPYEDDPVLLVERARALQMLADHKRADGDNVSAAEHLRAALKDVRVALKDPRDHDVAVHEVFVARLWSALAEISDDEGDRVRALEVLGRVIETYPRYPKRGAMMLKRARMLAQHGGSVAQIADAYRTVIIERGEEPVARQAEEALSSLLRRSNPDATPELLSVEQRLEQASNARDRFQPGFAVEILERHVLGNTNISEEIRLDAYFLRARSRFRARDYAGCLEDMERVRVRWSREDHWEQYERCLRYGGEHERASQLWADRAGREKSSTKVNRARWRAVTRAVIGGDYELAATRLEELGEKVRRGVDTDERAWLSGWIPYRRGLLASAEKGFRTYLQRKSPGRRFAAEYFLGKAMLRTREEGKRTEAIERLRSLERRGTESMESHGILGGFPAYYGLLARWLLVREGLEVSAPPLLRPVPDSNPHLNYPSARMAFAKRSEATRVLLPGLDRSEWLLAAGYLEESTQVFRVEVNRYLNGRSLAKRRKIRVPRSEALARGLSWKNAWEYPKPRPTREMILRLREDRFAEEVRADLEALAYLLDEPHWYAKLLPSARYPHRARNYLRPFRSDVERVAYRADLDPMIFWSLMYTESRFNPFVASQVGATGLMQIYPPALRRRLRARGAFDGFIDVDTLFNAQTNLAASVMWVEDFMRRFSGNLALVCASYNGGPHNVARWVRAKHVRGELSMDEFVEEIEFRETRNYVRRVISVYAVYHLLYDGVLPPVENDLSDLFTAGEFKMEEVSEKQPAEARATSPQLDAP